jgi:hypothetical protein
MSRLILSHLIILAITSFAANADEGASLDNLFLDADRIVQSSSAAPSALDKPEPPLLTAAPGSAASAQVVEKCAVSLNDVQTELEELLGNLADRQANLVAIGEAYKSASLAVPLATITQCTAELAAPIDALIADIAKVDFGEMRASVQRLTGCVVQHEAEINNQNDSYTQDRDSLSSRDALLLAAKLKRVSEVSADTLELSHEVERLDSKRVRMADAIDQTRSFCVDDF